MRGTVKVYQAYDEKPIFEESNLIVDGFKEHIVDIMTRVPAPAEVSASVSGSYNTSNFTVQAMSFSPNESNFERINSLACLSASINTSTSSGLDPLDGTAWSYREDIPNHSFSSVNLKGTPPSNSVLKNGLFSNTTNFFKNTTFKDYALDIELSGFYINDLLSLYELPNWEVQSELRYNPSSNEFEDTYEYGSCARYDMSANLPVVSSIYSMLSGTEASSTYAEPDDGILYVRSFAPSSTGGDSSGAVVLRQTAAVYGSSMEPWVSIEDETALDVVAEIRFQFSSTVGVDGAEIHVTAKDTITGDYYNFGTTAGYARHSWGGDGSALVVDASAGLSGTVSKFINVPKSRVKNPLEISYSFYSNSESDRLECYFWNPGLRIIDDWYIGNIWSGGDLATVSGNDFQSSGMYLDLSNVDSAFTDTDLSNVTYISQLGNMVPTKTYAYNVNLEYNTNAQNADMLRASLVKRYDSNVVQQGNYNLLSNIGASSLLETKLTNLTYAVSPELNRTADLSEYDGQGELVKPSDLCLEVSSSLSGSFSCSSNRTFIFKGEVLKQFHNGLSAEPVGFILETSAVNAEGNRLRFNFDTGNWVVSGDGTVFNSSSVFDAGRFSPFESTTIDPAPLIAQEVPLNSEGSFDFILTVSALGNHPSFVRSLRMDSLAIPASQQSKELMRFQNITDPTLIWGPVADEKNLFSGLTVGNVAVPLRVNPTSNQADALPTIPIHGMELATLSNHAYDTTYQAFIFRDTTDQGTASGELVKLTGAYLVDMATMLIEDEVEEDTLTSERYYRNSRRDIVGKPYVMMNNFSSLYGNEFYLQPALGMFVARDDYTYWNQGRPALQLFQLFNPAGVQREPNVLLCQSFALSDISLPESSDGLAFSFLYNMLFPAGQPTLKWSANANTSTGEIVYWDSSTSSWSPAGRGEEIRNDFIYPVSGTLAANELFNRTSVVDITNQHFDDGTVITFSIVINDVQNSEYFWLADWRFYNVTASAMFDLGVFPEPDDITVQPVNLPAGRLGQFTNNLEINASSISDERALGSANWAPDATTSSLASNSTGTIGSTHNEAGVVNSDGFVYSGVGAGGFYLSGWTTSSNSTSIVHVIDVSANDMNYFDLQGGIGGMGLWAFDVNKTYAKLLDNGYDLSSVYDYAGGAGKLYNVTDIDRNPVFKLLAKKVFRQPITIASGLTNPSLRIVWEINFL